MSRCKDVVGVTWSSEGGEPALRTAGWRSTGGEPYELLAGRRCLTQEILGMRFEASPEAFARPNLFLASSVAETVIEMSGASAKDVVWDAFSGQGMLSLPLLQARGCRYLVAIDRSQPALEALRHNFKLNNLDAKLEVLREDLGSPAFLRALMSRVLSSAGSQDKDYSPARIDENSGEGEGKHYLPVNLPRELPLPDILLADPGRNGMPKAFRRMLFELQVPRLVYVGMGKPLLRDVTLLARRGYALKKVVPFDAQPHSARFEVAVLLEWYGQPSDHDSEFRWEDDE
eukprot:TRINITY_DN5592_c0_g1_i6.p1 TRINITY_DN5592_c0_g1~~TRINITY_DN5592_c0_g1_i6.p1  ORF type:complete len:287 (-),score=56.83 TRINITY_DN5592_c0_g1_i6:217-1077(-)